MSVYFASIVESTENATWLLLKRAYTVGGHPVRENWLECMGLFIRCQVAYDV